MMSEMEFRSHAYERALEQLAALFVELTGASGRGLRFDLVTVQELRWAIGARLKTFLRETRVEELDASIEKLRALNRTAARSVHGKAGDMRERILEIQAERARLRCAGLYPPWPGACQKRA